MKPSPSVIHRIATEAARHVTSAGSCSGEKHNIKTIHCAIVEALSYKPRRKKK